MIKKTAVIILILQILLLFSYFSSFLDKIDPPNYIFFPLWFFVGIAGIVQFALMIKKQKSLLLSIVILCLSLIIITLGGLMRLFLTM